MEQTTTNNKKNIQVIVSNPVRQYSHQLCNGLFKKDRLKTFITSIWYNPESGFHKFLCSLPFLGNKIKHILLKRYDENLPFTKIIQKPGGEIFRQFKQALPFGKKDERLVLSMERKHDHFVSGQIKKKNFDIFIGYEKSCLESFKTAKNMGKTTILDLAQVHWKHIEYLRNNHPVFKSMQEEQLFNKISRLKEDEYQQADYIFTLSTFAKNTLISNGITPEKIKVVNLGFDPSKFKKKENYDKNSSSTLKLLFAGTISKRKGIHLLLEAVKQIKNVHLTLVGPVLDGQEYLYQYHDYYTYFPFLHHSELAKKYREADLFVFPSYLDSWAMVVLEAMASGTPVIVTENTGSKDAVKEGGGKIIPVDDINSLIEAIRFYKLNREKIQEDGIIAHQVAQKYTWNNYYNQVNNAIDEIISQ